jgi:hypothetical protein
VKPGFLDCQTALALQVSNLEHEPGIVDSGLRTVKRILVRDRHGVILGRFVENDVTTLFPRGVAGRAPVEDEIRRVELRLAYGHRYRCRRVQMQEGKFPYPRDNHALAV